MYRKALASLALVLVSITALVGCAGSSITEPTAPPHPAPEIPSAVEKPASATTLTILSISEGEVFIRQANVDVTTEAGGNPWQAVGVGMTLETGDAIKAGDGSRAVIIFFDGSTIEIEANSEVEVSELGITEEGSTTIRLKQVVGSTVSRVQKLTDSASRYEVETPACTAAVRGSTLRVVVDSSGNAVVYNLGGDIYVFGPGWELSVPEGGSLTFPFMGGSPTLSGSIVNPNPPGTEDGEIIEDEGPTRPGYASATFVLAVDGCESEGASYEISLNGGDYVPMTGNPPHRSFNHLQVGTVCHYFIRANDVEIISGRSGGLHQGMNVIYASYECAQLKFVYNGYLPQGMLEVSLDGENYFTLTSEGDGEQQVSSYTFYDLTPGKSYDYYVRLSFYDYPVERTTEPLVPGLNIEELLDLPLGDVP